jgi:ubiquinone/menaquinone biosynthesis C-methylase UbiE
MQTPFDKIAESYDTLFTETAIGKMQRKIVWNYFDKNFSANDQLNILELNCGTGEDVVYFAKKGFYVIATDISDAMLKLTEEKINKYGVEDNCKIKKLDLSNPTDFNFEQKFDLVFSNFGGLNCINKEALENLSESLSKVLKKNGRLVFVIMPRFCFWESIYFLLKLKFNKVFRRAFTIPLNVRLNGGNVKTYYYSPKNILKTFEKKFKLKKIKQVGFFIPPSFLNNFFLHRKKLLSVLEKSERVVSNLSFLSNVSDHFLIDMELKE